MLVRELPPLWQHIDVITPAGTHYRWADDEHGPENIPSGLRHSDTMPGGFESLDVTLPRKPGVDYGDLERLSTLQVIGAGGEVDGEYRLERVPRVSGDQMAVSPSAVGWQAHLDDDKSVRVIYIDRSLSQWASTPLSRQITLIGGTPNWRLGSDGVEANPNATPAIALSFNRLDLVSGSSNAVAESWYDARGIPLGGLFWSYDDRELGAAALGNAAWASQAVLTNDTALSSSDASSDIAGTVGAGSLFATTQTREFAVVSLSISGLNFTDDGEWRAEWSDLAVTGFHGLGLVGSGANSGFLGSDVVAHAVAQWAPLLNFTVGETILPSTFPITHLAFLDPTTVAEIIRQATRFGLEDWAVWENKTFYWHARDQSPRAKRWRARIGPAQLEETGPQVERLWESVIVQYQDVDGSTRTVGPPGSGADTESASLKDDDPENPANKLGITRRDLLIMGVSTAAGATEVGARFLEQAKLLDSSGRAQLVGHVEDEHGVLYPYSRVKAGDLISFTDAADTSYRRIVRADKARDTRTCSIDLDAPPEGLQALLERLGVVLVPLGVG